MIADNPLPDCALSLENVLLRNNRRRQTLVAIPDFDLLPGQSAAVMAPSGTGKTLLLKAVAGLLPDGIGLENEGSIRIGGRVVLGRKPIARQVSYIPQNALNAWAPGIPVVRQVRRAISGYKGNVEDLLAGVGLSMQEVEGKLPHQLSGGMCQRLLVAVAVARRPKLILADEPLGSTDRRTANMVLDVFSSELARGAALLMTTHNRADAEGFCQRTITLEKPRA